MTEFSFMDSFWCWLLGHEQPPTLKYVKATRTIEQACRRCGKTAAEIAKG